MDLQAWPAALTLLAFGAQALPVPLTRRLPRGACGRDAGGVGAVDAGGPRLSLGEAGSVLACPVVATPSPASLARELLWQAHLASVLFRVCAAVLLGLTSLGSTLLTVLSRTGPLLAYVTTVTVAAVIGFLPRLLVRGWRAQAYRLAPQLCPLQRRRSGWHRLAWWVLWCLALGLHWMLAAGLLIATSASGVDVHALTFVPYCLLMVALVRHRERRLRARMSPGPGQSAASGPAEQSVARLIAARDSLSLPASVRDVPVLPGRVAGYGVNAFALHQRGRWTVLVAPELLAELTDRQLRALIGHELGHAQRRPGRRRRMHTTLLVSAVFIGSWAAHASWHPVAEWAAPLPLDRASTAYSQALLAAMQVALGYLALCLLRPLRLRAARADETAADVAMVRATGDPQGCAELLAQLRRYLGSPCRLSFAQRAVAATHPSLEDRLALLPATARHTGRRTLTGRT